MKSYQNIETLIERMRFFMPSSGSWPFTVISLKSAELKGLSFEPHMLSSHQLLFLLRTDFNLVDFVDYISNTDEFHSIPVANQNIYIENYSQKMKGNSDLINWSEKVISLGIGIAIRLSETLDLCIEPIEVELPELNNTFRFRERNLKAYRLFDIYTCH